MTIYMSILWIIIRFWETAHLPLPKANILPKGEVIVNVGLGEG